MKRTEQKNTPPTSSSYSHFWRSKATIIIGIIAALFLMALSYTLVRSAEHTISKQTYRYTDDVADVSFSVPEGFIVKKDDGSNLVAAELDSLSNSAVVTHTIYDKSDSRIATVTFRKDIHNEYSNAPSEASTVLICSEPISRWKEDTREGKLLIPGFMYLASGYLPEQKLNIQIRTFVATKSINPFQSTTIQEQLFNTVINSISCPKQK